MKKFAFILSIDFLYAGIILFLVFNPTKQPAKQSNGTLHGYVYAEWNNDKKAEQVSLPGVVITVKDETGATADVVKSKPDGSYVTRPLKFGNYKIYLSKNGFPESWSEAFVGTVSGDPDPLKLNVNNGDYTRGPAKIKDDSIDY